MPKGAETGVDGQMEDPGRRRDLRRPPLGQGLFRHQQGRPRHRPPEQAPRPVHRPQGAGRSAAGPRHPAADPAPLHRHPAPSRRRDPRRLPEGHRASTTTRATTAASTRSRSTSSATSSRRSSTSARPFHFGLEAGSKPELLAVLALTNGMDTPIICNGFKDDEFIQMAMLARKIGKQIIPVVEKFTELEADPPPRRGPEGAAGHRRARQAGGPRGRPLALQRRLPLQVRPDADRGAGGRRVPQAARHGRLPAAGPLPPRQPDHQHPQHQERPDRGGPRLRRAAPRRRRRHVPRRRRRPRHRLRRLADRLRVVGQLHAAGVRQRRRLPHQERLRRGRRAAPDHHLRVGPGRGRLPQRAGLRRAGRLQLRPLRGRRPRSRPTPRSRSTTCSPSTAT